MKISVIIPTYNEVSRIGKLVMHLYHHRNDFLEEIIVCDGGSDDATVAQAKAAGAMVLPSPKRVGHPR